ncbi:MULTISPECIES: phosphate ABC transporter substrate-binding protein [unclassified Vibrio]|uniref:Phosphate-binding protein n=1 Tax=Vibrio sp. HB236076 TaxID=3232307 RepID=A0AB39HFT3_9VIBR|nr:phosphate ABC transporter substrate-binding protein [Vibrio sp. HB161653]MDP5253201.1 phosphate ABC transporter substrate-binding protein [Vibrio sp. HB161653]
MKSSLLLTLSLIITSSPFAAAAKTITVSGSTSVARIMDVLAESYEKQNPEHSIAVQAVDSSAGITLVNKGVVPIGMSSRYLTEAEKEPSMVVETLAYDGLAVVVNKANPIDNLTEKQLFNIYQGKITNWSELGGPDKKIAVVTREASSGSRYSFETLLGLTQIINEQLVSNANPGNLVVNSNGMMKTLVSNNPQSIGFISLGSVDQSVKALKFNGIEASNRNIANQSYGLIRPFIILYHHDRLDEEARAFIDYLHSKEAKQLMNDYGYSANKTAVQ